MTRNAECRRQVHEVLCGYEVGHEFILPEIITDMTMRHYPQRMKTKIQPTGRVSMILGEYVRRKLIGRITDSSTGKSTFTILKQVS